MAEETKETKKVWRGTHWAAVDADSEEAQAAPEAPAGDGAAPANAEALAEIEAAALADVKREITDAFADLATDFAQHVQDAKQELAAIVDQAKADFNTLLSGAIDQFDAAVKAAGGASPAPTEDATEKPAE